MVILKKMNFVGEVPLKLGASEKVVGTAKLEKLDSGILVVHVDASNNPEILYKGFSLGDFSIKEEENVDERQQGYEGSN